ncbi:MAG: zinc-finger-containing protein [Acidithiobacillus sp.]
MTVRCPYCDRKAELIDSAKIYSKSYGPRWICRPCDAHVGCHKGTTSPLGILANAATREERQAAHKVFDPLWQTADRLYPNPRHPKRLQKLARSRAYAWLADQLGIQECHISHSSEHTCRRIVELCKDMTAKQVRDWWKQTHNEAGKP